MDCPFTDAEAVSAFPEFNLELPYLGKGGFKIAYRGTNENTDLVLKILIEPLVEDDDEGEDVVPERFARELKGMIEVGSPRVAQICREPEIRVIGSNRHLWYAEQFYDGGTLEDHLASGPLQREAAIAIGLDLLEGVSDLWNSSGIVHRDIKPGNIAFDADGRAVLLDLGIAYFSTLDNLTDSFGVSPRTPIYAAPEQFEVRRNAQIDFRTDLFQVGIVLHECLTGNHPFWRPRIQMSEYLSRLDSFDQSSLIASGVSASVARVVGRLLAARPSRRYRSIGSAISALRGA